jgi:uncharacterized protein with von Willebrand factor type A (vWA) domain
MERRLIDFIAALRAAGVRVSIAESQDAFNAVQQIGVIDRRDFQDALRATLVKEAGDRATFDRLFPLYFGSGGPPLVNLLEDLSPEEKSLLGQALRALLEGMQRRGDSQEAGAFPQSQIGNLMELLRWLLQGQNPSPGQLDEAARLSGLESLMHPSHQPWLQGRMMRRLGMRWLERLMGQLAELLARLGMGQEAIDRLMGGIEANRDALAEQVGQHLGATIARQQAASYPGRKQDVSDLMHRPFQNLTEREADLLRNQVRRLAAQLRSRAALRRKRGKRGTLDVKRIVRANLRYGGVPMELKFKTRHQKPRLLLICDVSTSMRAVVEFLLRMIYELQDQVANAHTFAFIDHLEDISQDFAEYPPGVAIERVLRRLPPGYYSTDLGNSLRALTMHHAEAIDRRTTVIIVGDARNNYNDPRLDLAEQIQRRSKRVIWFNPEDPRIWGSGDSDMPLYLPYADVVRRVSNLAELTAAVDRLFAAG